MVTHLCECGCGQPTTVARQTDPMKGHTKGQPHRYVVGHGSRTIAPKDYRVGRGERNKRLHVIRAERALGKPLPPRAEVHHADGTRSDTAPLVICQDHAYHMFLHRLTRVLRAGGDPHRQRICAGCKRVLDFEHFYEADPLHIKPSRGFRCKECQREDQRLARARRKAVA